MIPRTHLAISSHLVGAVTHLVDGGARVTLQTAPEMAADAHGLVHGGFVFGLADYAAMLAVNHPNVVLGSAETRFVAPVRVGDVVVADATVTEARGRKSLVQVSASVGDRVVMTGAFTCFVLDQHVLAQEP